MNKPFISSICPRCGHDHLQSLFASPVQDVWTVLQCTKCLYTWRTTEPLRRSSYDEYPEKFRMTDEKMAHAAPIPAVPDLLKNRQE